MKEIWADISGYDGKYQVSTWGRVRNASGVMKPYKNEKGYLKICLTKESVRKKYRVSRLVAETFIPNVSGLPEVNHIDGNKENNSVTNLEWVSGAVNREHDKAAERGWIFNANMIAMFNGRSRLPLEGANDD